MFPLLFFVLKWGVENEFTILAAVYQVLPKLFKFTLVK